MAINYLLNRKDIYPISIKKQTNRIKHNSTNS
jgi:hypothetical protein